MTIALPVEQTRAEGLLGASEAAAALGLDKYTSPLTIWRRKRGLDSSDELPEAVREAAEWGQALEPVVRGKYALLVQRGIVVPVMSVVMDDWLRATPDGYVMKVGTCVVGVMDDERDRRAPGYVAGNADGLYQGKTASAWLRDEWEGGIPAKYEVQVRVEMAVTNLPWCDVCCLLGGQRFIGPIRVERDAALEDRILTDLRAFWALVQSGKEPSPDHTAAWRAHVSEKMRPSKVVLPADDELAELVTYWTAQRRKAKKAQEEADAAKNDLLLRLSAAGATAIEMPDGSRVAAYKVGGRTDYKAYAAAHLPCTKEDLAPYKSEGKTWTLRAPSGDDDE